MEDIIEGMRGTDFNSASELIEVLDEEGVSTGKAVTRKEIYKKGLWHRGVIVAIVNNNNEVLMQQRANTKDKYPGKWDLSVAGHIPFGEDSLSAVFSETMEEIGYTLPKKLTVQDFRFITSFRNRFKLAEDYIGNQFYDFFVLNAEVPIEKLILQKKEVQDVRYTSLTALLKMRDDKVLHPRTEWVDALIRYLKRQ